MNLLAYNYWLKKEVEVKLERVHHLPAGYGHKKVFFELNYNGSQKTFTTVSTDTEFFDNLDEDNYNEWQQLYVDHFFGDITERVDEWVSDVSESEEN